MRKALRVSAALSEAIALGLLLLAGDCLLFGGRYVAFLYIAVELAAGLGVGFGVLSLVLSGLARRWSPIDAAVPGAPLRTLGMRGITIASYVAALVALRAWFSFGWLSWVGKPIEQPDGPLYWWIATLGAGAAFGLAAAGFVYGARARRVTGEFDLRALSLAPPLLISGYLLLILLATRFAR